MLSQPIRDMLARVGAAEAVARESAGGSSLEFDRTTGRAAGVYERLRYIIDYREEHTIRRNAIERMLKRLVFIEGRADAGVLLLQELVTGSYIPESQATEGVAADVQEVITAFLELYRLSRGGEVLARRLFSFAATEIESRLSPLQYAIDQEVVEALFRTVQSQISVRGASDEMANAQLYTACWRSLVAADDDRLAYALWLLYVPEWKTSGSRAAVADKLPHVLSKIRSITRDPLQWQIVPKIRNASVYFRIIREMVIERGSGAASVLDNPHELDAYVRSLLAQKYEHELARVRSGGVRAVVYLFLTKMAIALMVEVPYDLYMFGKLAYVPFAVNAIFHPAVLFALTRRVTSLDARNTEAVAKGLHAALYETKVPSIRVRRGSSRFALAFGFAYAMIFFLVFGAIIGFLEVVGFHWVSVVLFLLFFALVSYFAFRIKRAARQWVVTVDHGVFATITGLLSVPIVRFGSWLSRTFSSINIFVIIMDFIIETPFKRLLNFLNEFSSYLRERIDEMR